MNCTSCGANLPQGAAQCQVCGTPTPYNVARPAGSPQYDPNVAAPQQPGPGSSPQYDPTVLAQPYGGTPNPPTPPSTAYGSPSYGTPPPPPPDAYNTPPASPYGAPPPQQNYYGTPTPSQGGYVAPPQQPGGMYAPQQPPQQPPKRRSRLPLILGIIALVLIVACAGISFAVYQGLKQTGNSLVSSINATSTADAATTTSTSNTPTTSTTPTTTNATPTTSSSGASPSGLPIDSTAAGIITNAQMASGVDSNFKPTTVKSTFGIKQTIYATFNIDPNAPPKGYVIGKWYSNGTYAFSSKILAVESNFVGYLSAEYNIATQGTVELYWCVQANCSDAKLADVVNFTVTPSSIRGTPPQALAFMDINRP
jgi:hypothetical protein